MLKNNDAFQQVEDFLNKNGIIPKFEKENGKITGRMMITMTDVPENVPISHKVNKYHAFECSFDFYDTTLGIALDTSNLKAVTGIWTTQYSDNDEIIEKEWHEFFIKTLINNIESDGSFGVPMYVFLNNTSDFVVVPSKK